MLEYSLGVITGILLTLPAIIVAIYLRPSTERFTNQMVSRLKSKGSVLEAPNEDMENLEEWVKSLKQE
jgi:hypothetical protein